MALSDNKKRICVVCASPIPDGAIYCKECGHYQSTLREFFSKPDITGLIALLSTSAIVFKFLNFTLFTPPLSISAYASQCEPTRFVLLFSNQGRRPGVIQEVEATRYYKRGGARIGEDQATIPLRSETAPVIDGGKANLVTLNFSPEPEHEFSAPRSELSLKTCYEVSYKIAEFGKQPDPRSTVLVSCECS